MRNEYDPPDDEEGDDDGEIDRINAELEQEHAEWLEAGSPRPEEETCRP